MIQMRTMARRHLAFARSPPTDSIRPSSRLSLGIVSEPTANKPSVATGDNVSSWIQASPRRRLHSTLPGKGIMKKIFLAWIAAATAAVAANIADGKGFFPVMVQVVDADSGTPIKGAMIRLEGAGNYRETEIDPQRQTKVLPESLGKPVATNAEGVGVVFFFAGSSSTTIGQKTTYSRPLVGTVVVELEGKEIYRSTLKAWAEKNRFRSDTSSAPWIVVSHAPPIKPR